MVEERRKEKGGGEAIISIFDKKFVQMFKDKIFGKLSLFYPERLAS